MNLKFWKRKKAPEKSDGGVADETIAAVETAPAPAKPGFWARLKNALPPLRRKNGPGKEEESEAPPPKPGFLARLKGALLPSRKKKKAGDEESPDEPKRSAKHADKRHRDEEPESPDIAAKKPRKRLVIALALLIPLAVGGGFFAASRLLPPPQQQKATPAKDTAMQEVKIDGNLAPQPAKTAEPAPQPEPGQPPAEPAPQQTDNTETPAAEAPPPVEEDIQAQIETLKKQNQEMQAQIEALKKQPAAEKPARPAAPATPREGVLIINGQNAKESAQELKKVIEGMNAASDAKGSGEK